MRKAFFFLFLFAFFSCGAFSYDFNIHKSSGVRYTETLGYAINSGDGVNIYCLDQEADYFFNRDLSVGIGFGLWMEALKNWDEDDFPAFKIPIYVTAGYYLLPGAFSPFAAIEAGRMFNFAFAGKSSLMLVPCAGLKFSIQSHFEVLLEIKAPMIEGRPMLIMPSIGVLI